MTPTLPPEFFTIPELQAMSGRKQRAGILGWLGAAKIQYVTGLHGWPMVYRTLLLPKSTQEAQNDAILFDFSAAHATRRTPARRKQS